MHTVGYVAHSPDKLSPSSVNDVAMETLLDRLRYCTGDRTKWPEILGSVARKGDSGLWQVE